MCWDAVVVVKVDRGAVEDELVEDGGGVSDEKLAGGLHTSYSVDEIRVKSLMHL